MSGRPAGEQHPPAVITRERGRELRRQQFPVHRRVAYLNHAAVAPLPVVSARAMEQVLAELRDHGATRYGRLVESNEGIRGLAADFIGASAEELAFVPSTSHGLSLVAFGLDWRSGDNVVLSSLEFPANVYPWLAQRERGVEVRMAACPRGWVGPADIAPLIDKRTRVVSVSSVQYGTGGRTDLPGLAELCHSRGVLLCVDAIQSLGALPLDVHELGVDMLAADGHKWLLGPEGVGLFYCASRHLERLRLSAAGWHTVQDFMRFERLQLELHPDARRFEPGSLDRIALSGLGSSLRLLHGLGSTAVWQRIEQLTGHLVQGLQRRGVPIMSPLEPAARSGIITFSAGGRDPAAEVKRLMDAGVFVSARSGGLRASPHFYNDEDELERLLDAL